MNTKFLKALFVSVAFAAATGACTIFEGRQSAESYADDTGISTKVKAAFVRDSQVPANQINVETMEGVVQLSGFVDSAQQKARAAEVARQIDGVRSVRNDIVVR